MSVLERVTVWLAPEETLAEKALPLTLLVRPVPLTALVLLGLNDHLFKGSGWVPPVVTGKLSDFAGMVYFPLLLVTGLNLVGAGVGRLRGQPVRWGSPTMRQVVVACVATAVFFSAVQVSPWVKDLYARATALLSFWSDAPYGQVTMDPTDIIAAPAVIVAWWQARRSLRLLPPGRLAAMQAQARGLPSPLPEAWPQVTGVADVWALVDDDGRAALRVLVEALRDGHEPEAEQALARLRA